MYDSLATVMLIVGVCLIVIGFLLMILDFDWARAWSDDVIKWSMAAGIFLSVLACVFGIYGNSISDKQHADACAQIGGTYAVVGHETTYVRTAPEEVDVYGCVKGTR